MFSRTNSYQFFLFFRFIRAFKMSFDLYYYLFPYFLFPLNNIILCSSIFLVLAITFERFLAVCHPYSYRIAAATQSISGRVSKLVVPVFAIAVIINIPKFFETKLIFSMVSFYEFSKVSGKRRKEKSYLINFHQTLALLPLYVVLAHVW